MSVAADENDRVVAAHRVELGDRGLSGPAGEAIPVAPDRASALAGRHSRDVLTDDPGDVGGIRRPAQIQALLRARPLQHVHVLVPKPRHGPAAAPLYDLLVEASRTQVSTDLPHHSSQNPDVDRLYRCRH